MPKTSTKKTINQGLRAAWKSPEAIESKEFIAGLEKAVFGAEQPQAVELEAVVLGGIMLDRDAFFKVNFLQPGHFYLDKHALIFDAIGQLAEKSHPIDLLTVTEKLKSMKKWKIGGTLNRHFRTIEKTQGFKSAIEAIGGAYQLVELTGRVGSAANIEYHARIIYQKYLYREGIRQAARFIGKAYAEEGDVFDLRNTLAENLIVNSPTGYFRVRSWDQVLNDAYHQPDMARLAGELLHKGSMTILFAPPGSGKSIGAVQLGNAIASAESIFPGILVNELAGDRLSQKEGQHLQVGFLDMELFDKEVEKRYTNDDKREERFQFSKNFWRIDPNPEFLDYPDEDIDRFINRQIESIIRQRRPDVFIVDNLTALSSESASDVNVAIRIMRFLKKLRIKYELTILVIGHTTKYGNKMEKLTLAAMKGASAIQDFAPTIFGISENYQEDGGYYLKQLKGRNGRVIYGKENVIKYYISKEGNQLKWVFDGFAMEDECLNSFMTQEDQDGYIEQAVKVKARDWSKGYRKIAKEIGYPYSHVTLMNKCREYVNGSKQYEFDVRGNIIKAEGEGAAEAPQNDFPKPEDPKVKAKADTSREIPF